jgi:hypothetical protein
MIADFVAMGLGEKMSDMVRGASSADRLTVALGIDPTKLGLGRDAVSSVGSGAGDRGDISSGASGGGGSPSSAGSCAACADFGGGAGGYSGRGSCVCPSSGPDGGLDSGMGTGCAGAGLGLSVSSCAVSCAGLLSRSGSIHVRAGGLGRRLGAEAISGGGCCPSGDSGSGAFGNSVGLVLCDCTFCSGSERSLMFGVFATEGGVPCTGVSCGSRGAMADPRTIHANEQSTSVATSLRGSIGCDPYWSNRIRSKHITV